MRYTEKSAPPPSGDRNEFIMSDASIDRMGDMIEADGWDLSHFKKHPIALFNHDPNQVIGKWSDVRIEGNRLVGRLDWAEQGTSPDIDKLRALHNQDILRAVSVGFRPLEKEKLTKEADEWFGPFRFTKQELLECSLVAVPANPRALSTAKSLGLSGDMLAEIFRKTADPISAAHPAKPGTHLMPTGKTMKTLSQQIEDKQNAINAARDTLNSIVNKDDRSGSEQELLGQMPDQIEVMIAELEQLRKIERINGLSTTPATPVRNVLHGEIQAPAIVKKDRIRPIERPGDLAVRKCTINLLSYIHKRHPEELLRDIYGNDEQTGIVLRAASRPALTTQSGWAAELVQTAQADMVDTLKPNRIYGQLAARGLKLTFGRSGVIKVPARAAAPTLAGDWIAEGAAIPVKEMGFTSVSITPKKLGVISVFSREIAAHSIPMIEDLVRDAMGNDTSFIVDTKLVSADVATALAPAGLRAGVAGLTPSASTTPAVAMVADIGALINAIIAVNGGRNLVVLLNPAQAFAIGAVLAPNGTFMFSGTDEAGRRFGVTFIASTTVTAKMVICVDAADYASVSGDVPEYDVSEQATLHMEDTAPLPIATGAQGSGVLATPTRSLFQTASIGIRYLQDLNWTMRRTGMVSWMQNVLW